MMADKIRRGGEGAFKFPVEKSDFILTGLPLYIFFFSLTTFNILSLFSVLVVLMIICHEQVVFWSSLFVSWRLPLPECANLPQDLRNFLLFY
jgi:hypothetical protein